MAVAVTVTRPGRPTCFCLDGCYIENSTGNASLKAEYKEPKKVYCSVWRQGSNGYQWTISDLDSADYNKIKGFYLNAGYVMIKEWELEYEPS